jgi:hypothetical protein
MSAHYKVDSTRVSMREYGFGSPRWQLPIALLLKLLRVRIPSSTDDPCVEAIAPHEIAEAELPDEVRERLEPLHKELESLGFGRPIYHSISSPHLYTRIYWAGRWPGFIIGSGAIRTPSDPTCSPSSSQGWTTDPTWFPPPGSPT